MSRSQFVTLGQLHIFPYAEIICYPKFDPKELHRRLKELKQLKIKAIEFTGEKTLFNTPVLGKGCVGIVVKALTCNGAVALKIRRIDANRAEMEHEAEMLKIANSINIGPKLLEASKNFLVTQFLEGQLFPEWLKNIKGKLGEQKLRKVLRQALEQCWKLDHARLDHGELSHAPKHIIVKADCTPYIIDFETASIKRKVSNLTSLCQYFFMANQPSKLIAKKLGIVDKEKLKQALRDYKRTISRENFEAVLKAVKLL